jgi:hypothetical protein
MLEIYNKYEKCNVCKDVYTFTHVEAMPGVFIFVCEDCLEAAKYHFIWICMNCGKVYLRPKKLVISRLRDPDLKRAYMMCEDMQIIQGIEMCIECDPEGISEYMDNMRFRAEC